MKKILLIVMFLSSCATCPRAININVMCPEPTPIVLEPKPEVETDIEYIDRIRRTMITMKYKIKELEEIVRCYKEQTNAR